MLIDINLINLKKQNKRRRKKKELTEPVVGMKIEMMIDWLIDCHFRLYLVRKHDKDSTLKLMKKNQLELQKNYVHFNEKYQFKKEEEEEDKNNNKRTC